MAASGRRIQLYVSDVDRAALDELPPDVSRSELLRIGLAHFRASSGGCQHRRVRCESCGRRVATSPPALATPASG